MSERQKKLTLCILIVLITLSFAVNVIAASKGYYENGELKFESNYVDGKLEGLCKEYYQNGKLKAEKIIAMENWKG